MVPANHVGITPTALIILPLALWPAADLVLWRRCLDGQGPNGTYNAATRWGSRRRKIVEDAYGRFLAWQIKEGRLSDTIKPVERFDTASIMDFVADMKGRGAAPNSLSMVIGALSGLVHAFDPTHDRRTLMRIAARLKVRAVPTRNKHLRVVPSSALCYFGIELMETVHTCHGAFFIASQYRDGLSIALLAARPLRIRNFQDIVLGETLLYKGGTYWLVFGEDETKTGREIEVKVPDPLVPYLETYLRVHRVVLGRKSGKKQMALWLDRRGQKLNEAALRENIKRRTRKKFGHAINPHLFRDCAATSNAIEDPEHVSNNMLILGHALMTTSEKHYNHARSLEASRDYTGTMVQMREIFVEIMAAQEPNEPAKGSGRDE